MKVTYPYQLDVTSEILYDQNLNHRGMYLDEIALRLVAGNFAEKHSTTQVSEIQPSQIFCDWFSRNDAKFYCLVAEVSIGGGTPKHIILVIRNDFGRFCDSDHANMLATLLRLVDDIMLGVKKPDIVTVTPFSTHVHIRYA